MHRNMHTLINTCMDRLTLAHTDKHMHAQILAQTDKHLHTLTNTYGMHRGDTVHALTDLLTNPCMHRHFIH